MGSRKINKIARPVEKGVVPGGWLKQNEQREILSKILDIRRGRGGECKHGDGSPKELFYINRVGTIPIFNDSRNMKLANHCDNF